MTEHLKDMELQCGKSCLRKYDKVYKYYLALEEGIYKDYCDDYGIDPSKAA